MAGRIRTGIIGLGNICNVHLKNIPQVRNAEITCVCDIDSGKAQARAKELGARSYADFRKMLDKEKLDAVVLATPQTVREEPIVICAQKKIPVFTEKPPARDVETGRRIAKAVGESKAMVSVGFVFRYLKVVRRVLEILKERPVIAMQLQYLCPMMYPDSRAGARDFYYKKEESGGLIIDQAIHMLDLCRHILGEEITGVQAMGGNILQPKTRDITTEETVIANLRSRSQRLVNYLHTWTHRGWESRVEIFAPDCRLNLNPFAKRLTGVMDGMDICYAPEDDGYANELAAFFEAVSSGKMKPVLSTYADSVKSLELAFRVSESVEKE